MPDGSARPEVWILGATGRTGAGVARRLAADAGVVPVLVGRDPARLDALAKSVGGAVETVTAGSVEAAAAEISRRRPAVVFNTIGPFHRTALPIALACLPGSHYLDLGNDMVAVPALLGLHDQATAAGRTLVTGAGFGVLATESAVVKVCEGRPTPSAVRVDHMPSLELTAGRIGEALAASIVEALPAGGRRYQGGRPVRTRLGADLEQVVLPDGTTLRTVGVPTGDLQAAFVASGAPSVVAATSEVPSGPAARALMPVLGSVLAVPALRRFATARLAAMEPKPRPRPREYSWARARAHWPDGTIRSCWLRAGEAMEFTVATAAEVARRLAAGAGRPGAYTPAAVFGADLALAAGASFVAETG